MGWRRYTLNTSWIVSNTIMDILVQHIYVHAGVFVCVVCMYACVLVCMYVLHDPCICLYVMWMCIVYLRVYVYACIEYVCVNVRVYMRTCVYVYTCVWICMFMYNRVCMCVYVHTHTHTHGRSQKRICVTHVEYTSAVFKLVVEHTDSVHNEVEDLSSRWVWPMRARYKSLVTRQFHPSCAACRRTANLSRPAWENEACSRPHHSNHLAKWNEYIWHEAKPKQTVSSLP